MALSPDSQLGSASSGDLQGLLGKDSLKFYYGHPEEPSSSERATAEFEADIASENLWAAPLDLWGPEVALMGTQEQTQLTFLNEPRGLEGSLGPQTVLKGSRGLLRMESREMSSANQALQGQLMTPVAPCQQDLRMGESPAGSSLSKESADREVKMDMQAESSDGSDPMDEDGDKVGARSSRRHLSKNLVAERKRRKKLNERLYSLRALVPKITKMDRASILGDAIEYVKQLQQEVKELQDELLEDETLVPNQADSQAIHGNPPTSEIHVEPQDVQTGNELPVGVEENHVGGEEPPALPVHVRRFDYPIQPMQVEVSLIDAQLYCLRIFCEKRPGVFVMLMQNLDRLGFDIVHVNITTFQGLALNVLNAQNNRKDDGPLHPVKLKESLLEMSKAAGFHSLYLSESVQRQIEPHPDDE